MTMLVTGATGAQGGAVARSLLARGDAVRILVRDPAAPAARALALAGAQLAIGSFEQPDALRAAMEGVTTLFSVQLAPGADPDSERRQARFLVDAARAADVAHVVHSSVSNAGDFQTMTGWVEGRWGRNYWQSKADAEEIVRTAGFSACTILRPAFMMDNFAMPKAAWMFPDMARGAIRTAINPDTPMVLVAADDIGQAVAAAIARPDIFAGQPIELAGDLLTLPAVAAIVRRVKGTDLRVATVDPDMLVSEGQHAGWVESQQWMNIVNYPARPDGMRALGLTPTSFAQWATCHAAAIHIGAGAPP